MEVEEASMNDQTSCSDENAKDTKKICGNLERHFTRSPDQLFLTSGKKLVDIPETNDVLLKKELVILSGYGAFPGRRTR